MSECASEFCSAHLPPAEGGDHRQCAISEQHPTLWESQSLEGHVLAQPIKEDRHLGREEVRRGVLNLPGCLTRGLKHKNWSEFINWPGISEEVSGTGCWAQCWLPGFNLGSATCGLCGPPCYSFFICKMGMVTRWRSESQCITSVKSYGLRGTMSGMWYQLCKYLHYHLHGSNGKKKVKSEHYRSKVVYINLSEGQNIFPGC